eukprot:scaffold159681_cov67-Attheya_sp.AAC.2
MWAQCDLEGNQYILLDSIVDHTSDGHAVKKADQMIVLNGRSTKCKTTKGWMLCVQWKDGTTTWERLSELKESNPVKVAEYAVSREIQSEPAFDWWVPYTLKKQDRIISAVNNRYVKRTHKLCISGAPADHTSLHAERQLLKRWLQLRLPKRRWKNHAN